jgi:hypothetical protein
MTTSSIDTHQAAKVSRFAMIWPLFLSGLVLIISGIFCWLNLYMFPGVNRDFAILAAPAHINLMTFFRKLPDGTLPVGVIIWILAGIAFAIIARTIIGKIALLFSFAVAIPLVLVGYFFGLLAIPIIT